MWLTLFGSSNTSGDWKMLKAGLPLPKQHHLRKKTVNNRKHIRAKRVPHQASHITHWFYWGPMFWKDFSWHRGPAGQAILVASLWALTNFRSSEHPRIFSNLLPSPNKVRIYHFFRSNIWLLSPKPLPPFSPPFNLSSKAS